jgi:heme oxygenase
MSRSPSPALQTLRDSTRAAHETLDGLFGRFDLATASDYSAFLTAHAMALPALESALDKAGMATMLDDWTARRRSDALAADLAAMCVPLPDPLPVPPAAGAPAAWGAAYVLEGSRLGGAMLARQVGDGLPRSYLGTPQPAGAWRKFLERLGDALSEPEDAAAAGVAASQAFALFERAGRLMLERRAA